MYSFLDLPTQKPLILKSVKYFTLDPDINLSLFSTGKWKCLALKKQKEQGGRGDFFCSFHSPTARDLQNLKGGSTSSLSSLFFLVEYTSSNTLDELSREIRHWHTLLSLSVGYIVHTMVLKSRKCYWVGGRAFVSLSSTCIALLKKADRKQATPFHTNAHSPKILWDMR